MTPEDKKRIFDYLGWRIEDDCTCERCGTEFTHNNLDGNDILEAVEVMENKIDEEKRTDLYKFFPFALGKWGFCKQEYFAYLLQNFFPLLAEWLKEGEK